ncbi:MAG TPA: DUF3455 domain-containing protein [Bryobacteraceae bacterium]|nr:DUF3455 domain-containing protein [Bryobacteraceae bacterium]
MRIGVGWLLVVCGQAQPLPAIPDTLKPPPHETVTLQVRAAGDQIYVCDHSGWVLSRPDAKLFDESAKQVGSHSAGPAWQYSDGSKVTAKPVANTTPDPDSIPWLLLTATGHEGEGVMKGVTSIQRLSTKGGKAPATGCDAQHTGQQARSHYTALYVFYTGPSR